MRVWSFEAVGCQRPTRKLLTSGEPSSAWCMLNTAMGPNNGRLITEHAKHPQINSIWHSGPTLRSIRSDGAHRRRKSGKHGGVASESEHTILGPGLIVPWRSELAGLLTAYRSAGAGGPDIKSRNQERIDACGGTGGCRHRRPGRRSMLRPTGVKKGNCNIQRQESSEAHSVMNVYRVDLPRAACVLVLLVTGWDAICDERLHRRIAYL